LGGGWYFLRPSDNNQLNLVPLIQAEAGPLKIRPENAGQTNVPHQDKLIYSRLKPNENLTDQKKTVELLLPPPETPVVIRQKAQLLHKQPNASKDNKPLIMNRDTIMKDDVENLSFPAFEPSQTSRPQLSEQEENSSKVLADKSNIPSASQMNQIDRKTIKGGFCIQIASLPSPDLAKKEWQRLQKSYASVLSNQKPHFARVDLGATKGVYHRVQVGHFKNRQEAQAICNRLNQVGPKLGCLVVPN
jgi:cell division septation protein DedD